MICASMISGSQTSKPIFLLSTCHKFNIAGDYWWLEDYFPTGVRNFSGANCKTSWGGVCLKKSVEKCQLLEFTRSNLLRLVKIMEYGNLGFCWNPRVFFGGDLRFHRF